MAAMLVYDAVIEELSKTIVGQDEAIQKLAVVTELFALKTLRYQTNPDLIENDTTPNINIFVTGKTGTGKTYMLQQLANLLDCKFHRIDCSLLTPEGYVGYNVSDAFKPLDCVKHAIVMLDEMDKLAINGGDNQKGYAAQTQAALLDILDGNKTKGDKYTLYPNTWLVVCAGSFQSSIREDRTRGPIGFNTTVDAVKEVSRRKDPRSILADSNLIPEIVGRLVDVIETKPLSVEDIYNLLTTKTNSAYDKYLKLIRSFSLSDSDLYDIAKAAHESPYGLRALDSIIFNYAAEHLKNRAAKKVKLLEIGK